MGYLVILVIAFVLVIYLKKEASKCIEIIKNWVSQYRIYVLIALGVIGFLFFTDITIIAIIACGIYYLYSNYMCKKRVAEWENKETKEIEYRILGTRIEKIVGLMALDDKNNGEYKFDSSNIPYGRANAFLNYFNRDLMNEEIYYFSAKPSMNENELREYGIVITGSGIFIANQISEKKSKLKEILFSGFDKVTYDTNTDTLIVENIVRYGTGLKRTRIVGNEVSIPLASIAKGLTTLKQYNVPCALFVNKITYDDALQNVNDAEKEFHRDLNMEHMKQNLGNVGAFASGSERQKIYDEMGNDMNMRQGHGYGAEYGNKTVERILGKKVEGIQERENGHHKKNGADKIVNGQRVQTKYCKSAGDTYREGFKNSEHNYSGQKIEVPRDQYDKVCELLQKDIDAGKMDGVKPGTPAENFVKKGYFDYPEAYRIAAAGGIEGIAVDLANGVMTSLTGASISALIVFASGIWQGKDLKDATKDSLMVAGQVVGKGAIIYTITMQATRKEFWVYTGVTKVDKYKIFGHALENGNPIYNVSKNAAEKVANSSLAKSSVGQKLKLDKLTGQKLTSGVITVAVVFGPDVCKACMGKISVKQLAKNATTGAAGIAGSVLGAGLTGGNPIGGAVGGAIAGSISKAILNEFIEDDAVRMFRVMKEEFLDVVMSSYLSQEEFNEVAQRTIWNKKVSKELQNMYKASKKGEHRAYANAIIEEVVLDVMKKRQKVTNEMWEDGLQLISA